MKAVRVHHLERPLELPAKNLALILLHPLNLVQDLNHVHVLVQRLNLHLVLVLDHDQSLALHLNHIADQDQDQNPLNQEILLNRDLDQNPNLRQDLDLVLLLNHGQDRDRVQSRDRGHDLVRNQGLPAEVVVLLVVAALRAVLKANDAIKYTNSCLINVASYTSISISIYIYEILFQ